MAGICKTILISILIAGAWSCDRSPDSKANDDEQQVGNVAKVEKDAGQTPPVVDVDPPIGKSDDNVKTKRKKKPAVLPTDDWEIGIPDGPPQPVDTTARVGQVGVEPPVFTKKVSPKYPKRAIKIKLQGYVVLEAIFRAEGTVEDIKVLRGLGKGKFGFEAEAVEALKQWTFQPGKVNGKPTDVRMTIKLDFVLQ